MSMPFMRSKEARPVTDPPKSELWEESTLLCPQSKLWGGQSLPAPLIFATDCKSCIISCQLAFFLILYFPCHLFPSSSSSPPHPIFLLFSSFCSSSSPHLLLLLFSSFSSPPPSILFLLL